MHPEPQIPDLTVILERPTEPERELPKLFPGNPELVIFDIGACEGDDSIRYGRAFPKARIFTFEPLPENQALITHNFKRYQIGNARLMPLALSNKAGAVQFHVSSGTPPSQFLGEKWNYGNKSSSLLPPTDKNPMFGWIEFKKTIDVQTETLDEVCRQQNITRIDFIHMDVQGAEALVLQGASRMLSHVTAFWLEVSEKQLYAGQMLRPEIEKIMTDAGFVLAFQSMREIEGDQFYVNPRDPRVKKYLFGRKVDGIKGRVSNRLGRLKRKLLQTVRGNS